MGRPRGEGRRKSLATRREVVVGTNKYANLTEKPLEAPEDALTAHRASRLEAVKAAKAAEADAKAALDALAATEDRTSAAVVDAAIAAAEAGATLGSLARARAGRVEPPSIQPLPTVRLGEDYEVLRARAAAADPARRQVFLANVGPIPQHKARADFSAGFFEVGGFEPIPNRGFPTAGEAARAALDSGAPIAVICSTDAVYPEVVPELTKAIKAEKPDMIVVLAGKPASDELDAAYREAGLDEAIHIRSNCLELLQTLQTRLGLDTEEM